MDSVEGNASLMKTAAGCVFGSDAVDGHFDLDRAARPAARCRRRRPARRAARRRWRRALVPLKLARVFTGRLSASSVVKVPLMVGVSVSMALTFSPVTCTDCCTAPTASAASRRSSWRTSRVTAGGGPFLESGGIDSHRVATGFDIEEAVVAHPVRFGGAHGAFVGVGQCDRGVGNHGAGRVLHRADDGALRGLSMCVDTGQSKCEEQSKRRQERAKPPLSQGMRMLKHRSLSPEELQFIRGFCCEGLGDMAPKIPAQGGRADAPRFVDCARSLVFVTAFPGRRNGTKVDSGQLPAWDDLWGSLCEFSLPTFC